MQSTSLLAQENGSPLGTAGSIAEQPIGVLSVGVFESETPVASEPPAVEQMKSENWFSKMLNLFRRKKAVEAAPAPVQTEWSLDRVKVVRNDLTDVDLDIVFTSVDGAKKAPAKKEQLVSSAWRRVSPNPQKQEQMVLK